MQNSFFSPITAILNDADALLAQDYGFLNTVQERFIESITVVARELQTLLVSMSGLSTEATRDLLSYETRSHLASIIGYAEVLLDETEGPLTEQQVHYVREIRTNGTQVLTAITNMLDS